MGKTPQIYYSSDWHFGHTDIINFERTQFSSIKDHDEYLVHMIETWADKWEFGSTLWFLGDFGNPEFLWVFDLLRIKGINVNFLFGNHDRKEDFQGLGYYVNNIYFYPTYLSQKLVVSHFPVAVYKDQINILNCYDLKLINFSINLTKCFTSLKARKPGIYGSSIFINS